MPVDLVESLGSDPYAAAVLLAGVGALLTGLGILVTAMGDRRRQGRPRRQQGEREEKQQRRDSARLSGLAGWESLPGVDAAVAAEAARRIREAIRRGEARVALVRDDCPGELVFDLASMDLKCMTEEAVEGGREEVRELD